MHHTQPHTHTLTHSLLPPTNPAPQDAILTFQWSRMFVVDEIKDFARLTSLTFIDFLEALGRTADMKSLPNLEDIQAAGARASLAWQDGLPPGLEGFQAAGACAGLAWRALGMQRLDDGLWVSARELELQLESGLKSKVGIRGWRLYALLEGTQAHG